MTTQDAQDAKDGLALRLLMAALPEGWYYELHQPYAAGADVTVKDLDGLWVVRRNSGTIAEAADACRAALERRA